MVIVDDSTKGRGRPKLNLEVILQRDLSFLDITEHYDLTEFNGKHGFIEWTQLIEIKARVDLVWCALNHA